MTDKKTNKDNIKIRIPKFRFPNFSDYNFSFLIRVLFPLGFVIIAYIIFEPVIHNIFGENSMFLIILFAVIFMIFFMTRSRRMI